MTGHRVCLAALLTFPFRGLVIGANHIQSSGVLQEIAMISYLHVCVSLYYRNTGS